MLPTLTLLDILKYIQQKVSNMQNVNIVIMFENIFQELSKSIKWKSF